MGKEPNAALPTDATDQDDLVQVIRQLSGSMDRLLHLGLNKKAVVVLIKDDTGLPKKVIEQVLGSLTSLADKYTEKSQ